jgi:ribosome-binding protein aMBF1 (putative translation factor)
MSTLTDKTASQPSQHKQTKWRPTTKDYGTYSLTAQMGRTIRRLRMDQDKTLRQLANQSYVALSFLAEVETGKKNASPHTVESICSGLGITTLEFMQELCVTIEKGW